MKRKIILLKNLEMNGVIYEEGTEVELEPEIYDWLVQQYVNDRQIEWNSAIEANQIIEKVKRVKKALL